MRLAIADKHDVIAFVGADRAAASSRPRSGRIGASGWPRCAASRARLDLARAGLSQLERGGAPGPGLGRAAGGGPGRAPARGGRRPGRARPDRRDDRGCPRAARARSLGPGRGPRRGRRRGTAPAAGRRASAAPVSGTRPVGSLDFWGDGRPASAGARVALSDLARVLALVLAGSGTGGGTVSRTPGLPEPRPRE